MLAISAHFAARTRSSAIRSVSGIVRLARKQLLAVLGRLRKSGDGILIIALGHTIVLVRG